MQLNDNNTSMPTTLEFEEEPIHIDELTLHYMTQYNRHMYYASNNVDSY
jgi:hypothetical protein